MMKTGKCINRILVWAVAVCTLAGIAGCYNDQELLERLADQERRLAALDQVCTRINTNIASLQTIIRALQENDYIYSAVPIVSDGKVTGYTLSFNKRGDVTIYYGRDGQDGQDGRDGTDGADGKNGQDGKDGSVPVIGSQQDEDGVWYWTLNGEWLLDAAGKKVQTAGQDGITPQLKIEAGCWYVSIDDGSTWTFLCKAAGADGTNGKNGTDGKDGANGKDGTDGKDGDSIFKSVTQDADYVYITLADSQVFTIPKSGPLSISFWTDEAGYYADTLVLPPMFDCLTLHYVVTSPTNNIVVQTVTSGDMEAYVIPDQAKPLEGIIRIKTLDNLHVDLDSGQLLSKVLVIVASETCTIMHSLVCQESKLIRVDHDRVDIRQEGGKLDFHYQTNTPVSISIPDSAKTWCWQVKTKAQLADSIVSVHFEPNLGAKMRRTSVSVTNPFGIGRPGVITFYIYQDCNNEPIVFADSGLKQYLVDNRKVNLNGDSEISEAEAAAVPNLYTLFGTGVTEGRDYRRFNEFQYFTGIDTIPDRGFNKWRSLDSITLPESIKVIGTRKGIFQDCPNLKSFKGKYTRNNAIVYNNQLLRVAPAVAYDGQFIPDGVEIIGNKAVTGSQTSDLFIPSSVKKIRDHAFEYSNISKVWFAMTTDNPETGTAYIDSLSETAFNHCFKLSKFIGPTKKGSLRVTRDHLGLIRDATFYAFALGADTTSFVIPENAGVSTIAEGVFDLTDETGNPVNIKLKNLGLPSSVKHISTHAFRNAKNLIVWFKGGNPPTRVESGAFNDATGFGVAVPAVLDGGKIDKARTQTRVAEFRAALGISEVSYYDPAQWATVFEDDGIVFQDSKLKAKLIANGVDTNGDGEISYKEAKAVKTMEALLGSSLQNASFSSFDEFQYFTGITTLPAGSFNDWTKLTTVTLPGSIETIGIDFKDKAGTSPTPDKTVFRNCPQLNEIKGKFASEDEKALIYRRKGETTSKLVKVCETIPAFYIPEGVDTIARYCFYKSKAKDVQFPKSLKVIGDCAFEHSAIENVKFPLGDGSSKANPDVDTCRVTTVYDRTFAHCYNLKKFEGARVNGKLKVCAEDRVLYGNSTVYAYALGSIEQKVVIPDDKNIKRLADCVFEMVSPEGYLLPADQSKLEVIVLPTGISHIGARTFYNQAKLMQLFFHGSAVPAECGSQALAMVHSDAWIYVPAGASVDDFAKKLNYNQVTTWETWNH